MTQYSKDSEIILSTTENRKSVAYGVETGSLRKLAPKLYTNNLDDKPEAIVKRNLWQIISLLVPNALVADRTAIELKPSSDGSIFIISERKRDIELPGVTIRTRKGHKPLPSDKPFLEGLYLSSFARSFLENMRISRPRKGEVSRTLSKEQLEEKLDAILRKSGDDELKKLRDEARKISKKLGLEKEQKRLDDLVGTLLGTKEVKLKSKAGIARKSGLPFDPKRLVLFEKLHHELRQTLPTTKITKKTYEALPFFEAYFSNFIEGTEFEVSEAEEICFEGKLPINRPADGHDILGTYRIVSNSKEIKKIPKNFNDFTELLLSRHGVLMKGRPDKNPGKFKTEGNRAGSTLFVAPELVEGTLKKGFEIFQSIEAPFNKAVFMMFLVAEVHPFADGNGRIARIMMNAELVSKDEQRIIIPTVYRNNYLSALKALSHNSVTEPLVRMLEFAQNYTSRIDWSSLKSAKDDLINTNAMIDPNEADLEGIRLKLPS